MQELMTISPPSDNNPYRAVADIDFSEVPPGSTTFQDKTGKTFVRGGGTAIVQSDSTGTFALFNGTGGFETDFPTDAFLNATSVQIIVDFNPVTPPTSGSAYQALLETGAARSPRFNGYLHCFNNARYETWITMGSSSPMIPSTTVRGNTRQKHVILHDISAGTVTIERFDANDQSLGVTSGSAGAIGTTGATLSVGSAWVAGRRFFMNGRIYSLRIGVMK